MSVVAASEMVPAAYLLFESIQDGRSDRGESRVLAMLVCSCTGD